MLKRTEALLHQFGLNTISEAKANAPKSSGALADSLKYSVTITEDELIVSFDSEPYGKFQDKGVQGADPSKVKGGYNKAPGSPFKFGNGGGSSSGTLRGGIDKWVVRKGLDGIRDDKGRFISRKSMVYLISKSIYFTGLRPTLFFTRPYKRQSARLESSIAKAMELDYEKEIKINIKGGNLTVK